MNRSLFRIAAHLQLALAFMLATGCTPTQPFFVNESPDLQHYLNTATSIEYPDVEVASLPETTEARPPLSIGNHDYEFWNLTVEECVAIALNNAKIIPVSGGTAELQQGISAQIVSSSADQLSTIYDIAIQQTTTQTAALATDGNGNRLLPRGALRANQVGGVEDALAEFDAVASGFIDLSTTDRPQNVGSANFINPQISVAQNTTQQFALSKRLATGGSATLRQQTLYSRNNTPIQANSRLFPSDYTAILEAQVQHPLMRNRGTFINRIPVVLASLNEDISIAQYEGQIRNLVRNVEVAYWDLYLAYRSVSASRVARDSAMATARFANLNYESGTGTIQEVSQAEGQFHRFNARLMAALAGSNLPGDDRLGVYGRERALRALLGLSATDGKLIRPIEEPTTARVEADWDEAVAQMLYLSPELRSTKYLIKQSELELALAKNQVLPEVNLSLLYRWVGLGDTLGPPNGGSPFPNAGSSALGSLTSGDFQEGAIRLEISQPVALRRELARVQNAKTRLKLRQEVLREQERHATFQLGDAMGSIPADYQLMQEIAQQWQAAEQEVEARLSEYEGGIGNVNVVLQSQERLAEAQLSYYRALTEYSKTLNFVDFLKGTLLANSNITLREGPWNTKAYCDALERARERSAGRQLQYGVTRPGVVRRGPVQNGQTAIRMSDQNGFDGNGTIISDEIISEGDVILQPPTDSAPYGQPLDPSDMQLQPYRQNVPIDDTPLQDMGDSTYDLFTPQEITPNPNGIPTPTPDPSINGPAIGNGIIDAPTEGSILQPRSLDDFNRNDFNGNTDSAQPVAPMNYESPRAAPNRSNESPSGFAPTPVRRKPVPVYR